MNKHLSIFVAGLLFGSGLVVSGMINPGKVLGFLDLFGNWDPSLAFVMAAAVAVNFVGFRLVTRRSGPLFGARFAIPTRRDLDRKLVIGACLFGIGWGLAGFCPGPAIAALGIAPERAGIFVLAMLIGMLLPKLRSGTRSRAART